MQKHRKNLVSLSLSLILLLAFTGLAGAAQTEYPLTLNNFSFTAEGLWEPAPQTFEATPSRVVANTQAAAEMFIKLGLADKLVGVGALFGSVPEDVAEEFAAIPVLSENYMTQEIVLGADPDLVYGRGDLFNASDYGVGAVGDLNAMGIRTYLMHSTADGCTIEALYQDIDELGLLFNAAEAANAFREDLQSRVATLEAAVSGVETPKTYVILVPSADGTWSVFGGARMSMQEDLLRRMRMECALDEMIIGIGMEQLIDWNPDVILMLNSNMATVDSNIATIMEEASLQDVTAVRDSAVFSLDFSTATYSFRIVDILEELMPQIYPEAF